MKADYTVMMRHLHLLFDSCSDGMIELAFGCPAPNKALLSHVRELDRLAGEGVLQNGRGYNIYIGANVRGADTAPFARAKDRDVICAPAIVVDLDLPGRAEHAPNLWGELPPSFCVVTGQHPHKRMQMWWLLDEPMLSLDIWSCLQRAMAAKYDGDATVTNPSRVMRLAGSIAQPVKEGRVLEPTFLENVREPLPHYSVGQITEHCEPFLSPGCPQPERVALEREVALSSGNSLGLLNGSKLIDGREAYMRDTVLACLRAFIGKHGARPTPEELYNDAWPQYEQHVIIDVPGKKHRGAEELFAQCRYTLTRFARGDISTMRDLDAAIASHEARHPPTPEPETFAAPTPPPQPAAPPIPAFQFPWRDVASVPPRDWLYGTDYIRGYTSCTVAPGAAGKSSLLTVEALAMASGKPLLGIEPKGQLGVWMWNGEDPLEEVERRAFAVMQAYGLTIEDIQGHLFLGSGRDRRLKLVGSVKGATQVDAPLANQLVATMQRHVVDVMMLDPLVAIHSAGENDNVAIDALVKEIDGISQRARLAAMLAHHSRKTNGNEVTTEDARGASALLFAVRSGRVINTMTKDEAARVGVRNPRRYFRLENGKLNMAPPPEAASWYELKSQQLGNGSMGIGGDEVAVVWQWRMPDVMEGYGGSDVERVFRQLGSGAWLVDPRAKQWAGIAVAQVLGLDINDTSSKARVKMMLKRWEHSGALRQVRRPDPATRHERTFYEVAERLENDD